MVSDVTAWKGERQGALRPTAHDTPYFDHAANYRGHEVQAPRRLHDPSAAIEALVRLARDPKDRKIVGTDGVVKTFKLLK
jgi:hypothetical protein